MACDDDKLSGRYASFALNAGYLEEVAMYKVLVIDADREARFMIRKFPWMRYGFEMPEEAASGREALERLSSGNVDLMVTDIRLPDMDGIDFLRQVNTSNSPCTVLLSSCSDFEYAQQGIGMGVFDYMVKPLSNEIFSSMIQRVEIFLHRMTNADRAENYKEMEFGVEKKESDEVTIDTIEKEKMILANMLLSGNEEFLSKLENFENFCNELSENKRDEIYNSATKIFAETFNRKFPWMKNIEPLQEYDDMDTVAKTLFGQIERFDLVKENSLFRSICAFVYDNIEEGISLRMAADQLGISADYAGRIFKRRTNIHFATFVMEMKMERGKNLLVKTKLRNYEISNRLGYSNPDYFRQLFKAYTGVTPTEYRNSHRYMIQR